MLSFSWKALASVLSHMSNQVFFRENLDDYMLTSFSRKAIWTCERLCRYFTILLRKHLLENLRKTRRRTSLSYFHITGVWFREPWTNKGVKAHSPEIRWQKKQRRGFRVQKQNSMAAGFQKEAFHHALSLLQTSRQTRTTECLWNCLLTQREHDYVHYNL